MREEAAEGYRVWGVVRESDRGTGSQKGTRGFERRRISVWGWSEGYL